MIYLTTALYSEAKPLITELALKKNTTFLHSNVYENEHLTLLVTGVGKLCAAIALTELLTRKPPAKQDILCNVGIAACANIDSFHQLFYCHSITDAATDRTFYPDRLFADAFSKAALTTTDRIITPADIPQTEHSASTLSQVPALFDMEAYGISQAALRYFSCERIFFFKVPSDAGISSHAEQPIQPELILEPHYKTILSFLEQVQTLLAATQSAADILSAETLSLSEEFATYFSFSVSMQNQLKQYLLYGTLLSLPVEVYLKEQLEAAKLSPSHKKEGKKQLALFQKKLMSFADTYTATTTAAHTATDSASITKAEQIPAYHPAFSTIYIEKDLAEHPLVQEITSHFSKSDILFISHYKDIFNRSHQNSMLQKQSPALILAAKHGTLLYPGAPVCQSFGNAHFYYTSCSMNCPYDCEYCYLQGMYPSSHLVLFVNSDDYFKEVSSLLMKHPVYLCASYDTDLLALEHLTHLAVRWSSFVQEQPDLTVELRTKSANMTAIRSLTVSDRLILAWTLSPDCVIEAWEHKTPSLASRLKAARLAKDLGFPVRLCFDPLLYFPNYKEAYQDLLEQVFSYFKPEELYDISLGVFRCSKDFIKLMRKSRPASALLQYPYENEQGVYHYGTKRSEELLDTLKQMLLSYHMPEEKIFLWEPETDEI